MKRGQPQGYTILEVMIFLAVTTALFVMVAITFQGRQARTEFSAGVREMESRIQDMVNDVTTGYTASDENFSCSVAANDGELIFSQGQSSELGTNGDCIFLGRVMHFGVTGNKKQYKVYSVAGARQYQGKSATNIIQLRPKVIPNTETDYQYPVGVEYGGMKLVIKNNTPDRPAMGVFAYGGAGVSNFQMAVLPLPDSANISHASSADVISSVAALKDADLSNPLVKNEKEWLELLTVVAAGTDSFRLCLLSDGSDQHAVITIGGTYRSGSVDAVIGEGRSCPGF